MDPKELQRLRNTDIRKTLNSIANAFRGVHWLAVFSAAYIIAKTEGKRTRSFNAFLEEYQIKAQLSPVLFNTVGEKWDVVNELAETCSADDCKALLLFDESTIKLGHFCETPAGLAVLSAKLLDISSGGKIADLCTGTLSFIRECRALGADCDFLGSETDNDIRNIAMMRADILEDNITVTSEDSLNLYGKYDNVFCHAEFGMKWKDFEPDCGHSASADWLFAEKCVELLSDNGKAVCIMTNGSTWNQSDRKMREKFITAGYIETMIALPANIYSSTAVSTTLMVLSKGNKQVNLVDATEIFTPSRRINLLTDNDISEILEAIGSSSSISCTVSNEEIAGNNYELYPKNYTEKQPDISNAVPFSEIISRITRGAQIKADELDALVCEKETGTRLLMLSDMTKGIISDKLRYINTLDKRLVKYCAADGAIILSKNGYPVKSAVTDISGDEKILVNGNLYIIELDKTKAEPYYIKAYFDSEQGQALLKSICVGVTIPNIPVEALKKLPIPMRPLKDQKRIAARYLKKQREVIELQKKLEKAEEELTTVFTSTSTE